MKVALYGKGGYFILKKLIILLWVTSVLSLIIPYHISAKEKTYDVISVVDGDTFNCLYQGKKEKVRLLGIDTPESVHPKKSRNTKWGKKTSDYTKKLLSGEKVYLHFDRQKRDCYGRLLAYVFVKDKGKKVSINETLVSLGYARAVYYAPNGKHRKKFLQLQTKARKKRLGIWKKKGDFEKAFQEEK